MPKRPPTNETESCQGDRPAALGLRDLGGVIVNDFIDMREERHRRGVERAALLGHQARSRTDEDPPQCSAFGLIEMTRQRIRPSLKRSIYEDCPH